MTDALITVHQALEVISRKQGVLIDIRGAEAWFDGIPQGARCHDVSYVKAHREALLSAHDQLLLICHRGQRSTQLAAELGAGFVSVTGGMTAWRQHDLPTEVPEKLAINRYDRQLKLSGFSTQMQQQLAQATVLIVGVGGLGAPAAAYLAGAGVGRLILVDDDEVAIHNLHRQVLYQESDQGQPKVVAAQRHLNNRNHEVDIDVHPIRLDADCAGQLIAQADVVLDGSDNLATRYLINDACQQQSKPWVMAAVSGFDLQVAVFSSQQGDPCYRTVFGDLSQADVGDCNADGVLGPVPAVAAMLQCTEVIKIITGIGAPLKNQMIAYDLLQHRFKVIKYAPIANQ